MFQSLQNQNLHEKWSLHSAGVYVMLTVGRHHLKNRLANMGTSESQEEFLGNQINNCICFVAHITQA